MDFSCWQNKAPGYGNNQRSAFFRLLLLLLSFLFHRNPFCMLVWLFAVLFYVLFLTKCYAKNWITAKINRMKLGRIAMCSVKARPPRANIERACSRSSSIPLTLCFCTDYYRNSYVHWPKFIAIQIKKCINFSSSPLIIVTLIIMTYARSAFALPIHSNEATRINS